MLILDILQLALALLKICVKVGREVFDLLDLCPHPDLHHNEFLLADVERSVAVEVLETLEDLPLLHVVENIHLLDKLMQVDGCVGEEGLRGKLSELFILYPALNHLILKAGKCILEVV